MEMLRIITSKKGKNGKLLFNALVYSNISSATSLDEIFYVYRGTKDPGDIKLGHPEWRDYCKKRYKDKEQINEFNLMQNDRINTASHNGVYETNRVLTHHNINPKKKTQITIVLDQGDIE
jgi:hypothetical protein